MEKTMKETVYTSIGKCEFCGRESNQRSDESVICTRCIDIITNQLWQLKEEEPAKKAYKRAAEICKLRGRIDQLREENEALRNEVDEYRRIINKEN